jgi:hypothetical protein
MTPPVDSHYLPVCHLPLSPPPLVLPPGLFSNEVNRREVSECDGWVCDLDDTGNAVDIVRFCEDVSQNIIYYESMKRKLKTVRYPSRLFIMNGWFICSWWITVLFFEKRELKKKRKQWGGPEDTRTGKLRAAQWREVDYATNIRNNP